MSNGREALGGQTPEAAPVDKDAPSKEALRTKINELRKQLDELKRLLSDSEGTEVSVEGLAAGVESLVADMDLYLPAELSLSVEIIGLMVQEALDIAKTIEQAQSLVNDLAQEDPHRAELLDSAEKTQQALVACVSETDRDARFELWNSTVIPRVEGMSSALMPIKADLLSQEIGGVENTGDKHVYARLLHKITSGGFSDEVRRKLIRELDAKFPQYADHRLEMPNKQGDPKDAEGDVGESKELEVSEEEVRAWFNERYREIAAAIGSIITTVLGDNKIDLEIRKDFIRNLTAGLDRLHTSVMAYSDALIRAGGALSEEVSGGKENMKRAFSLFRNSFDVPLSEGSRLTAQGLLRQRGLWDSVNTELQLVSRIQQELESYSTSFVSSGDNPSS